MKMRIKRKQFWWTAHTIWTKERIFNGMYNWYMSVSMARVKHQQKD